MPEFEGIDPGGDQEGAPVVIQSEYDGSPTGRPIRELLGAAKRDAASPASKKRGPYKKRVNPTSRQRAPGGKFPARPPRPEGRGPQNRPFWEGGEPIPPPPPRRARRAGDDQAA